jgi:hypothetical protein
LEKKAQKEAMVSLLGDTSPSIETVELDPVQ